MPYSGQNVNNAVDKNTVTTGSPLAPELVSAVIFCAFGLWSAPALLLVYVALTGTAVAVETLFAYLALTGLSATCLRLLFGFLLKPVDGPGLVLAMLIALLVLSLLLVAVANSAVMPFVLPALTLLAGIGGGGFAIMSGPSMSPRRRNQDGLETSSMLGQLGLVASLLLLPLLVTFAFPSQSGRLLLTDGSHFIGRVAAGTPIWLGWIGAFWGLLCALILILWALRPAWHRPGIWPQAARAAGLLVLGLLFATVGAWLLLPTALSGASLPLWIVAVLIAPLLCLLALRLMLNVQRWQPLYLLCSHQQLWVLGLSWVATLGSLLGFTLVFPLLTAVVFRSPAPALGGLGYPGVFLYAWMLPLAALMARPLGRWAASRWGGVRVSQVCMLVLAVAALAVALCIYNAQQATYPPDYFSGYLVSFAVLFIASGLAHAALVQALIAIFPAGLRYNAGVWLMSMATLGMTCVPLVLANTTARGFSDAFVSFAIFYLLCVLLSGFYYFRHRSFIYNP